MLDVPPFKMPLPLSVFSMELVFALTMVGTGSCLAENKTQAFTVAAH